MMDLVERYITAVRRNLPTAKASDIAAEIAEDLQSRREDREDALGRPLTREETSALLKDFGHPLVVAGRFRSHQYLIGPDVYPFYLFVMKIVLAIGAALLAGVAIVSVTLGGNDLLPIVAQAIANLFSFLLVPIAVVTILFAVLERSGFPSDHLASWTPERLPDPIDKPQSQLESAIEVGLGLAMLLWWTGILEISQFVGRMPIEAAPIWDDYYVPILLLLSVQLLVNLMKWLRPRWKVAASLMTIVTCVATLAIVAGLMKAQIWVVATGTAEPNVADGVNLAIRIALVAVAAVMTLQALGEVWKLVRYRRGSLA
jgi:hypothetical protein